MFQKSRRKIVAVIMTALVLVWAGTLGIIYGTSYYQVSRQNHEMLKRHAQLYVLGQPRAASALPAPEQPKGPDPLPPRPENTPAFHLSTFYSVAVSKEGRILAVENSQTALYTDETLTGTALALIGEQRTEGSAGRLLFQVEDKGFYTLVAFMDNTIVRESMTTLFRYTLIFGGLAILVLFFLARYLALRIVQPLEDSYQKQRQFISDAGHELKTPVSVICANADLLARELGENQWLSNIQYENRQMSELVSQLLDLARTEAAAPQKELLDFSRLIQGEALPFESMIYEKGFTFSCQITDRLYVRGNSTQLRQLTAILLENALAHCGPGKEISLTLKRRHHFVLLSVANDGPAIPPEQLSQLFQRFYRLDPARSGEDSDDGREKHYGLGLAIAKAITEAHQGRIEASCENGRVIFSVRLSCASNNRLD